MMCQVAGAFMEYEKGRLVAKLRGARERKPKETDKRSEKGRGALLTRNGNGARGSDPTVRAPPRR
jgi:hypothetical protein